MEANTYGLARLWLDGDFVTRAVALVLVLMSILSWTVMIARGLQQWRMRRGSRAAAQFWHRHSFSEGLALFANDHGSAEYRQLAMDGKAATDHHGESRDDLHGQLSLSEWLSESLRASIDDSADRMQSGLPMLASIGATAPFVGLLGTVWGIYHALIMIGVTGQSTIDKVAGPVGEALIMTAAGLFVAIPAVLGYNALSRANRRSVAMLHRFARQLHSYFLTGSPGAVKSSRGTAAPATVAPATIAPATAAPLEA